MSRLVAEPKSPMLVVATLSHVRSIFVLPRFFGLARRCVAAAEASPGNRGVRIKVQSPLRWATITGWDDEAAMIAFVRGPVHMAAMRETRAVSRQNFFARFTTDQDLSELAWTDVLAHLDPAAPRVAQAA
ncbi:MAG: hypothetical protein R3B70_35700 [Polyangiaceae bacterium]